MKERKAFLMESKHQCHLSQREEWMYGTQLRKKMRLLSKSMFIPIDKWALTLKMMEKKAFLIKPKHQCHLSQ